MEKGRLGRGRDLSGRMLFRPGRAGAWARPGWNLPRKRSLARPGAGSAPGRQRSGALCTGPVRETAQAAGP